MLTRDQILAAEDTQTEVVDVPEWGGQVRLRTLTGGERDQFEAFVARAGDRKDFSGMRQMLLSMALVDESGAPLFGKNDLEKLGKRNGAILDRLFQRATALSGIGTAAAEAAEKNS